MLARHRCQPAMQPRSRYRSGLAPGTGGATGASRPKAPSRFSRALG